MKISTDLRTNVDKSRIDVKGETSSRAGFGEIIQKHSYKLQSEQLHTLMRDIEVAGNRLGNSRTFQDLAKYKTLVKRFMEESVEFGMELNQSHHWTNDGQSRHLQIVKQVDESLISLTEDVMNQEKTRINILSSIGEIKGLLINLYM
ncbi:YaaR family protein [Sutcliffiella halmapala]|uniref:YaaR family protein n=1 Tax=Sutcliffiella halmapala TaxID=79882 RepID=UPI000995C2FF|nr:YaaR family protein [Sutcliffiella halmapala]